MGNAPARAASTLNGLRRIGLNYLKITTSNRSTKKEPEAEMRKKIITPNDLSAIVNPFFGCEDYDTAEMAGGGTKTKRSESLWQQLISNFFPSSWQQGSWIAGWLDSWAPR